MKSSKQNFFLVYRQGFSIIEVLLVLSVIVVLGTLSSLFFSRLVNQNYLANTQDQILGQMRKAQIYAMMGKQNGTWGVNYSANKITLFQGNSFASRNTAFDEIFSVNSSISIAGFSEIIFAKRTGLPTPASVSATISANVGNKTFTLNSYGVASR